MTENPPRPVSFISWISRSQLVANERCSRVVVTSSKYLSRSAYFQCLCDRSNFKPLTKLNLTSKSLDLNDCRSIGTHRKMNSSKAKIHRVCCLFPSTRLLSVKMGLVLIPSFLILYPFNDKSLLIKISRCDKHSPSAWARIKSRDGVIVKESRRILTISKTFGTMLVFVYILHNNFN